MLGGIVTGVSFLTPPICPPSPLPPAILDAVIAVSSSRGRLADGSPVLSIVQIE